MADRRRIAPNAESTQGGPRFEFPPKLVPLMEHLERGGDPSKRRRYYVAYGGRGSAKSWTFARALILQSFRDPLRILCVREIMRTIQDSVHQLIVDQIELMEFGAYFEATESAITNKATGAEFRFAGLRQQDAHKIKSFEGVDIVWVEEAQTVTKRSWEILVPTIRAEASEIWATFNPELDDDDTYTRFVVHPPDDAFVARVNWEDNPWFPDVLETERRALLKRDKAEHDHIWGGLPRSVVPGAIYAREVAEMIEEGRVTAVPYNPSLPVHTVWDLGWNDQMAIILVQKVVSSVEVIEYLEGSFQTYAEWVAELHKRRYVWGQDWLPHDGAQHEPRTGKSAQQWLRGLGRRDVRIIDRLPVEMGIKAARMLFPRIRLDAQKAGALSNCLKRYRRSVPESTGEPRNPVHDQYSHGADAFRGLAVCVDKITNEDETLMGEHEEYVLHDRAMGM